MNIKEISLLIFIIVVKVAQKTTRVFDRNIEKYVSFLFFMSNG